MTDRLLTSLVRGDYDGGAGPETGRVLHLDRDDVLRVGPQAGDGVALKTDSGGVRVDVRTYTAFGEEAAEMDAGKLLCTRDALKSSSIVNKYSNEK